YLTALYEYLVPISYDEMVAMSEVKLREQILQTYRHGLKRGIDIFGLEEELYRQHPKLWRKLSNDGSRRIIDEDSIRKLDIHLTIPYTGKYKRKV
ncbi:hypothetical protein BZG21_37350, partial [Escherichia coli]|nr:hypothetical protein [Escherichia coli]